MRCETCGGAIIHDLGDSLNGPRDYCMACGREPKRGEIMAYHLDPKKEEEIKGLLKDHSVREIVIKTGVAFNTIRRIRNENFTEEEKAALKKSANIKGANRRELKKRETALDLLKDGRNIPKIIPSEKIVSQVTMLDNDGKGGQETMPEQTQACTNPKCPKPNPQPIGEFNKNAARPSGRESRCRTCTAQAQRDRKAAIEKASAAGTGRSGKVPRNGRRKRKPRDPEQARSLASHPVISDAVTLDVQLLRAVKKSAVLDFVKNDLPGIVEKALV